MTSYNPPLRLLIAQEMQRRIRKRKQLKTLVEMLLANGGNPALGYILFRYALSERSKWQRYLWSNFGYDWHKGEWHRDPLQSVQTQSDVDCFRGGCLDVADWHGAIMKGLHVAQEYSNRGYPHPDVFIGLGILDAIEQDIIVDAANLEDPLAPDHHRLFATVRVAGYIASRTARKGRLKAALNTGNVNLLDEIAQVTPLAWASQSNKPDLKVLLSNARETIIRDRRGQTPTKKTKIIPIPDTYEIADSFSIEEFAALREVDWLSSAKLSPQERQVTELQLHPHRYKDKEIAQMLGIKPGQVAQVWARARGKLERAYYNLARID